MTGRRGTSPRSLPIRLLVVAVTAPAVLIAASTPAVAAAPQTTIVSGPSGLIATRSATFRFKSSRRASSFQCRMDGSRWSKCASPKRYSSLGQGQHTFRVRARKGGAVDRTPATRTFIVDTVAPDTTVGFSAPAVYENRIADYGQFAWTRSSSETPVTYECRMDAAPFTPCPHTSPLDELIPDRNYVFYVRARDAAGNVDPTPASMPVDTVSMMSFNDETGIAAGEHLLADQLISDVPARCDGDPNTLDIDCPGGDPAPPADQVSMTSSTRSVTRILGTEVYDVAATMDVETLLPIQITLSGTTCDVTFDSSQGDIPTWRFEMDLFIVTHPTYYERHLVDGNHTVGDVESEDWDFSGGPFCDFFDGSLNVEDFMEGLLEDQMLPVCMAPGPQLLETCPWGVD